MNDREIEWAQRIAVLELKVENLSAEFKKHTESTNEKLDSLLELRDKGMGAFWLVSAIFGSGVLAAAAWLFGLFKGG